MSCQTAVLFVCSSNDWCQRAYRSLAKHGANAKLNVSYLSFDKIPGRTSKQSVLDSYSVIRRWLDDNRHDRRVILAFKADLLIPCWALREADLALNVHPAPPHYRGIGGYYHEAYRSHNGGEPSIQWGVTIHHMSEAYDDGSIMHVYSKQHRWDSQRNWVLNGWDLANSASEMCFELLPYIKSIVSGAVRETSSRHEWSGPLYNSSKLIPFIREHTREIEYREVLDFFGLTTDCELYSKLFSSPKAFASRKEIHANHITIASTRFSAA